MKYIKILNTDFYYDENNITIIDSYQINNYHIMRYYFRLFYLLTKFDFQDNQENFINEWFAHNLLYNMHLFKKHTKDVDLSNQQSKILTHIYNIIGGVYKWFILRQ